MKLFSKISLVFFSFLSFYVLNARSQRSHDFSDNINYKDAFNQDSIHDQYRDLLKSWGCDHNIFSSMPASTYPITSVIKRKAFAEPVDLQTMEKEFQQACLNKLYSARRWALAEPAIEDLVFVSLISAGTAIVSKMIDKESLGGSLALTNTIFNSVFVLKNIVKLGYDFMFPKQTALTKFEEQFAINQCFIPRSLWPAIREKFIMARQNQFEQGRALNFLEFALGLMIYKPKSLPNLQGKTISEIIEILHHNIDDFFAHYEQQDQELQLIKINVTKFILRLLTNSTETSRYIYFHGPAGIGKTFFVNQLSSWIEELVPGSVRFDEMVITDAMELEGNAQRPGALLRILRNQALANKRGSVVFMDEATWLNQMQSAAKRTFNGDQSAMSTTYFGDGVEGVGIDIAIPPMLFFLASNDEITDPALKNRFDVVSFPNPSKQYLVDYAIKRAKASSLLVGVTLPERKLFETWLDEKNITNFRQIESLVEHFVLSSA